MDCLRISAFYLCLDAKHIFEYEVKPGRVKVNEVEWAKLRAALNCPGISSLQQS